MNTSPERPQSANWRFVLAHPGHFIAFGFGVGLVPWAPGTFGTLLALPLYHGLALVLDERAMLIFVAACLAVGVWACQVSGRRLGVHDHGGMVWDEIAAFMLVLWFVPANWTWQVAAFALFRLFDIVKPPPIRNLDRGIRNGFGVMLDDIVAAFYALLCLAAWRHINGSMTMVW